jgi:hypothetical protein
MVNRESVEELARRICRELYEFTDGQPNKSRRIVGGDLMHRAMLFAIGCGGLKVDSEGIRIGLTDEGRQEVRKTLS